MGYSIMKIASCVVSAAKAMAFELVEDAELPGKGRYSCNP